MNAAVLEDPALVQGYLGQHPKLSAGALSAARHFLRWASAHDLAYKDFFYRNDLDTEVYNAVLNFQTAHPRLMLGGMASIDYSSPWCIYWALDVMDFMLCLVASAFAWIIVDFVQDVRDFVGRR